MAEANWADKDSNRGGVRLTRAEMRSGWIERPPNTDRQLLHEDHRKTQKRGRQSTKENKSLSLVAELYDLVTRAQLDLSLIGHDGSPTFTEAAQWRAQHTDGPWEAGSEGVRGGCTAICTRPL
jgi:hypothetical protein